MQTTPQNHFEVGESEIRSSGDKVEYRVRPVTRYIITRYYATENTGGVEQRGEFDNYRTAHDVAYALCKLDHDLAGTSRGDPGFQYPSFSEDESSRID